MIGQILEFSRLDADPQEERSPIDLDELLRAIVEDVKFEYGGTGVRIGFEALSSGDTNGYPNALRSGVENVLRNAVQHNRDGGEIQVQFDRQGTQAVITITDQGGGVAEGELDRIFEPFYRSTRGPNGSQPGSGLGLAIASRAIALNQGSLTASNTEGGLCIQIRLPLSK